MRTRYCSLLREKLVEYPSPLARYWGSDDKSTVILPLPGPASTLTLPPGATTCEASTFAVFASTAWTRSILTVWSHEFIQQPGDHVVGRPCRLQRRQGIAAGPALINMRGLSWSKINFAVCAAIGYDKYRLPSAGRRSPGIIEAGE
jgi:hypothetical protein